MATWEHHFDFLVVFSCATHSQHCDCLSHQGPLEVSAGCLLSGLELTASQHLKQLTLTSDIIIQGHRIELGDMKLMVYTVMGAKDDLQVRAISHSFHKRFFTVILTLYFLYNKLDKHLTVIFGWGRAFDSCDSFCYECQRPNLEMEGVSFNMNTRNSLKPVLKALKKIPYFTHYKVFQIIRRTVIDWSIF